MPSLPSDRPAARRPARSDPQPDALRYLELDLLWSDRGPVAALRLANTADHPVVAEVHVYADTDRGPRELGRARLPLPAHGAREARIDLERDFPTVGAWLQRSDADRPVRIWAGSPDHARVEVTQ